MEIESMQDSTINTVILIAKYDFYFQDIIDEVSNLEIEVLCFKDIDGIPVDLNPKDSIIFFPHYSKIIPVEITERFTCIGFHTGDLPMDRGGSPIQNKIRKKQYYTKVSAIRLTSKLDAGPIYLQTDIDLSVSSLDVILREISHKISKMIRDILLENYHPVEQSGIGNVNIRLTSNDSKISRSVKDLRSIFDQIRMVDGFDYPRAFLDFENFRILLSNASLQENSVTGNFTIVRKD
jgi:methionyl-tRNA formyltransferase